VRLSSDVPIVGCVLGGVRCVFWSRAHCFSSVELSPYVLLRRPDGSCTTDEGEGYFVRCRWLRSSSRQRSSSGTCVHGSPATLQSVQFRTFHCSAECFVAGWRESQRQRLAAGPSPASLPPFLSHSW